MVGSSWAITQYPVGRGCESVEAAVKALLGKTLLKVIDTGFCHCDKSNIKDPEIAAILCDRQDDEDGHHPNHPCRA